MEADGDCARIRRSNKRTNTERQDRAKRNEIQTYETYGIRAPRRGSRQNVRANVRGRDQQAGRGKISPTHPRCGIDHWWRASEYLQNRSRRTAGLIRRALELIPTTPILKRTSFDATEATRWPRVPRENSNVRDLNFRKRKIRRVYEIRAIIKRQS